MIRSSNLGILDGCVSAYVESRVVERESIRRRIFRDGQAQPLQLRSSGHQPIYLEYEAPQWSQPLPCHDVARNG